MRKSEDQLIKLLEDSVKYGVIAKGYLEVVRSIQQKKSKLVVIAKDVDNKAMSQEITRLCNIYETPLVTNLNKLQLGNIVGLKIATGFLSIKISGLKKSEFNKYVSFVAKAKSQ